MNTTNPLGTHNLPTKHNKVVGFHGLFFKIILLLNSPLRKSYQFTVQIFNWISTGKYSAICFAIIYLDMKVDHFHGKKGSYEYKIYIYN